MWSPISQGKQALEGALLLGGTRSAVQAPEGFGGVLAEDHVF